MQNLCCASTWRCWRERDVAADLTDRLQPVAHLRTVSGFTGSVARLTGLRWMLDGVAQRARAVFEFAVRSWEQIHFRPELALAWLDLPKPIPAHYPGERRKAVDLVRVVTVEAQVMRMHPTLKAALHLSQSMAAEHASTRRQLQVASPIGSGRRNREIAEALVITEATAEVDVKHVLAKLGLKSCRKLLCGPPNTTSIHD